MLPTRPDAGLYWIFVHIGDLSHQIVFLLIQKFCAENTGCDWPCADPNILQLLDKLQILMEEQRSCDPQCFPVCYPYAPFKLWLHASILLRTSKLGVL